MGSPQQGAAVDKPPNSKAAAASAAAAATVPVATAPPAIAMVPYPDWGGYIAPAWAGQAMMPAYGVPYAPMFYAHPGMPVVAPCQNAESEGRKRPRGKSADGKVSSDSAQEDASDSGGTESEGSSPTGNVSTEPQVRQDFTAGGKRTMSKAPLEGDVAQAVVLYNSPTPELSHGGRVSKLPVSAPGRTTLPDPATNLNMGLEVSDALYAGTGGAKVFLDVANSAPGMPRCERPLPDHQWMQMSERELRREKRKQSNRESARRSRLRKQASLKEKSPGFLTEEEYAHLRKRDEISVLEVGRFAPNRVETDDK